MLNPIARCMAATGRSSTATLLMLRLNYLENHSKLSGVKKHGERWIVFSQQQWCAETGMTLKQYTKALSLLKTLGLVDTRVYLFSGALTTHMKLSDKGSTLMRGPDLKKKSKVS